jgi:hypothetical protein
MQITILNADSRQAKEVLKLHEKKSYDSNALPAIDLGEYEAVEFSCVLEKEYFDIELRLHEIAIDGPTCEYKGGLWHYNWVPKSNKEFGREKIFLNYCGLAELSLWAQELEDTEYVCIKEFNPINVLAAKMNAEKIESMLRFLARDDGQHLANLLRVTRKLSGYKEGGKTASFLLDQVEHSLELLKKILPKIILQPITKLDQISRIVTPSQATNIDEASLTWITENSDFLYPTPYFDESVISFNGEYFTSNKILETQVLTSCDVYENQIIHGFIKILIRDVKKIEQGLTGIPSTRRPSDESEGYVSFFEQMNNFKDLLNQKQKDLCSKLIKELNKIFINLEHRLPVTTALCECPLFTQKAKYNIYYKQIFRKIIAWFSYGQPDWSAQKELNSITNIPKLFEYYLFAVLQYHLEETTEEASMKEDCFEYQQGKTQVRLRYEPKFWVVNDSRVNFLVNTEGWAENNKKTKLFERKPNSQHSNRSPDFTIEICHNNQKPTYFIIDAKYKKTNAAFKDLSELTMKYLHGIHENKTGINLSEALMVVNPCEKGEITKHFHHKDYSIYGDYPVTPALMVTSIDVSKAHEKSSNLRQDLSKVIELIIEHQSKKPISHDLVA